ncbi:MAG: CHAD domain-containing protein [Solirubrobacteraceae bacterium]
MTRTSIGLGFGLGVSVGVALAVGSARRRAAQEELSELDARPRTDVPGQPAARGSSARTQPDPHGAGKAASKPLDIPAQAVLAILLEQVDAAMYALETGEQDDLERAVHEARKAIKRARSLLRLLRAELPRRRRRRANAALRDAARVLTASREADVALETLDAVAARAHKRVWRSRGVPRLRNLLERERSVARQRLHRGRPRERALASLRRARAQATAPAPLHSGDDAPGRARHDGGSLHAGLEVIYRRGRRAMRVAERERTVAAMHDWRKRVKDLRYATEALDGIACKQKPLRNLARRADTLGETLGEEHDLALLRDRIRSERRLFRGEQRARRALLKQVARDRMRLRKRATAAGRKLYGAKPRRFGRSVREQLR